MLELEIWNVPSSCGISQICCSDLENFAFWPKNCQKVVAILDFGSFLAIKWLKSKIFKIARHQMCLMPHMEGTFQISLAYLLFKWMYIFCVYFIYNLMPIFKNSLLGLGTIFLMRFFHLFHLTEILRNKKTCFWNSRGSLRH